MSASLCIRQAAETDARDLLAIYRPFVEASVVSFETVAPTVDEFAARIAKAVAGWQWLVAEHDGRCVGYAYGGVHRERAAYRWSARTRSPPPPGRTSGRRRGSGGSAWAPRR